MKEKLIVPAVIAKDQKELDTAIGKVKDFAKVVQLDIMDNQFVPNSSLWFDFSLPKTSSQYEAHLMIQNPADWIEKHSEKVDTLIFHFEATDDRFAAVAWVHSGVFVALVRWCDGCRRVVCNAAVPGQRSWAGYLFQGFSE